MNIQLVLDRLTIEQAIATAEQVRPYVDWIGKKHSIAWLLVRLDLPSLRGTGSG